ncbi:unnamed protein product [Bemisia tabaci]|uniref:Regulatory protein zeste n=1 Tax=Bemisia tabaci TaxID=7038 RepID=A0A9P0AAV4_BEMTA|nr:unnamed protein product [Bemisia tabaci]
MSDKQRSLLIQYMAKHSIFAKSGVSPGSINVKKTADQWDQLIKILNANGPPRNKTSWKQALQSLKTNKGARARWSPGIGFRGCRRMRVPNSESRGDNFLISSSFEFGSLDAEFLFDCRQSKADRRKNPYQ